MSIRDYNQKYVVINGTTNEQIVVPKVSNDIVNISIPLQDFILFKIFKDELQDCEAVTIFRSYMKD